MIEQVIFKNKASFESQFAVAMSDFLVKDIA
jgi:hypothetical protein